MSETTQADNTATEPSTVYFDWNGAEAYSRLSRSLLRRQVAAERLNVIRIGGRVLIRRDDLDAFLEAHRETGRAKQGRGVRQVNPLLDQ